MTGKASRDKGRRWELALAHWFGTSTTANTRPGSHDDGGDVVPPADLHAVIEAKDVGRWTVAAWFDHLTTKCTHGETPLLILKRRNRPTGDALVVMRLSDYWPTEETP